MFGAELPQAEKNKLAQQLRARPHEYVAQEQIALSSAPVWDNGCLNSRSVVLRTYVMNTGNGWIAIPGGLVRVAGEKVPSSPCSAVVTARTHGCCGTVRWIPSACCALATNRCNSVDFPRAVPSSVADNVFWLGRYAERAESISRILRAIIPRASRAEEADLGCLIRLHSCLETRHSKLPKPKDKRPATTADLEQELISLVSDVKRGDSVASTLAEVSRIGGNVRERLSADMMFLIGQLRDSIQIAKGTQLPEYAPVLTNCLGLLSAFSGMERENINRGLGWVFLSMGRRLERAMYITRQLREIATPLSEEDWPLLECILEVADSSMTYRTRYYTTLQPLPVLDVLMADETNPRSLDFQLTHLAELYQKLPRHLSADLDAMRNALVDSEALISVRSNISGTNGNVSGNDGDGLLRLERFLRNLEGLLPFWSNNLSSHYFSLARTFPVTIGQ